MREDILLLFLSPVQFSKDQKVVESHYTNLSGENTHMTNESAVRYILENDKKLSKIFIIASKYVREEIENCPEKITHLEYFKNRVGKFLENVEDCISEETIFKYDEKKSDNEYNLESVAVMAEKIQNFARKSGNEIFLHVDLTGGMRHINMIILDVIRLLEYSGVKIGKIIYSNYTRTEKKGTVEEINDIYDLFRLISGVEEFIKFGSVEILNEYYKKHSGKISDPLKKLLDAMKNFADAIKLCRYDKFKNAIENLHDAIHDFGKNFSDEKNVNDMLMARLIDRINSEYEMLIATRGQQNDLKIIRWCINKGYLQQALTLYTERVPEYLNENKFYEINPSEYEKIEKKLKKDVRNEGFYFLNNYLEKSDDDDETAKKFQEKIGIMGNKLDKLNIKFFEQIKKAIRDKNFSFADWRKNFFDAEKVSEEYILDEKILRDRLEILAELKKSPQILLNLFDEKLNPIRPIINEISDELEKNPKGFMRQKKIFDFVGNANNNLLKKFFPIFEFDQRNFRLKYMSREKIFILKVSEEKFLSIADKYFRVKDERNHSNHARSTRMGADEFSSAKELENFMLLGLAEIENAMEERNS